MPVVAAVLFLLSALVFLAVAGTTKSISSKLLDVSLNLIVSPSIDTNTNVDSSGIVIDSVITKGWTINKYTVSAAVGSIDYVHGFMTSYITSTQSTYDSLGCYDLTKKLIGYLTSDDNILHVIDSSVYPDIDRSVKVWSDYMESLGAVTHNVFMHNKIQLYVPDISPPLQCNKWKRKCII